MSYLQKFNTHNDYLNAKNTNSTNLNSYTPWVCYDGEHVHYFNDNIYYVGDVIESYNLNGTNRRLVCVIPSNFIDNGKARFIVDDTTINKTWFSDSNVDVTTLGYKNNVCAIRNASTNDQEFTGTQFSTFLGTATSSDISGENIQTRGWAFFPTDSTRFTLHPTNSDAILDYKAKNWYDYGSSTGGYGISPYIQRSASDPLQFNRDYLKGLATSDFDGLGNTNKIVAFYNNNYSSGGYECAAKYIRDIYGPESYLPSVGELGFLIARLTEINAKLSNGLSLSAYFWSSTLCSATYVYTLNTSDGNIRIDFKYSSNGVRAFVQL